MTDKSKAKADQELEEELDQLVKATKSELLDKILLTAKIKEGEIAELVELYYDAQGFRLRNLNRDRSEEPSLLVKWLGKWLGIGERGIYKILRNWAESEDSPLDVKWSYSQDGIGPVLACGLSAHIDFAKAETISSLWKFAGQAPGFDRKIKGQKLAYNSRLKVLCWKLGESFVKVSGRETSVYGQLYLRFKSEEVRKNETGLYQEAAKKELASKKFKEEKDSVARKRLLAGKLSDAHLHARAKRKTVKIFLSHLWCKGREVRGMSVTEPYSIAILRHRGKIEPSRAT